MLCDASTLLNEYVIKWGLIMGPKLYIYIIILEREHRLIFTGKFSWSSFTKADSSSDRLVSLFLPANSACGGSPRVLQNQKPAYFFRNELVSDSAAHWGLLPWALLADKKRWTNQKLRKILPEPPENSPWADRCQTMPNFGAPMPWHRLASACIRPWLCTTLHTAQHSSTKLS